MSRHHILPPEVWLEILHWAALPTEGICPTEYQPFQPAPPDKQDSHTSITRRSLPLVCHSWYIWSTDLLYKDITIVQKGSNCLKETLEKTKPSGRDLGRKILRVVLPYTSTVTGPALSLPTFEILKHCTQIETLVRPAARIWDALLFEFDAEIVPLPNLKRLEWWIHQGAERSGGLNSLGAVLRSSPNLQYLFIGGAWHNFIFMDWLPIHLPKLHTMRIQAINAYILWHITKSWSLPALDCVILDAPLLDEGTDNLWAAFGPQVKTVEFGNHLHFLIRDNISPCLEGCPNLTQINYNIFATTPPTTTRPHSSLSTIGICCPAYIDLNDTSPAWDHLACHFEFLASAALPSLRCVVLYGDWKCILPHPLFSAWKMQLINERSVEIVLDGPTWNQV